MNKTISLICVSLLAFFMLDLNAQSLTVNVTDKKQYISLMGGDMERSANAIQTSNNTNEMVKWGFEDIAFNTCRIQFDKKQELNQGTKDWSFYDRQILTMKAVKNVNPGIKFWGTLRSDYDGFGNNNIEVSR